MSDPLPNDPLCQALALLIQRLRAEPRKCLTSKLEFEGGFDITNINSLAIAARFVAPPKQVFEVTPDPEEKDREVLLLYAPDGWPPIRLVTRDPILGTDRDAAGKIALMIEALQQWLSRRQKQLESEVVPAQPVAESDPSPRKKGRKKTGRRRGRPISSVETADARIVAAWNSGQYKNYEDLARELKILNRNNRPDASKVEQALDRHRKRHPPAASE
jgi:hypothetical protein